MRHVLVIAQEINQAYINQIVEAMNEDTILDVVSGTEVSGNKIKWIKSPKYDPHSLKSRLQCWMRYLRFINNWASKQNTHYDFIFAVSNPPINSYIGLKLKRQFQSPFIYMNWDLYPQIIETTISSPIVKIPCYMWRKWNTRNYPKIDQMITIGPRMAESIRKATKSDIQLSIIPLGVDPEKLRPVSKNKNKFLIENKLTDKFIVLFSGKMGLGHNLELILKVAEKLENTKDIMFVFIGNGPKYCIVEEYIRTKNPENVRLFSWQDADMYPYSIACGDIAIVTEEKAAEGLMLPSRVFSMMSCGEAIIGVCGKNDDLYSLIEDNEIGKCVVNGDADELCETIVALYHDGDSLDKMKNRARRLVEERHSINVSIQAYRDVFNVIGGR